ncbi:MAG TPA: glycosyltransferase family 4 protein [Vicinamibacterales bacterium]|nr:glycosyltransferase family 4 protein [Vicinamibacterales bacterium]
MSDGRADPSRLRPRVHQILATLGYGDAIGHEVLGIARALRGAGYESEIIVETADPRLEDLTVDYRDMVDAVTSDDILVHHFSLGSRASRTAFALPCRMILIYHNITPPEYFLGVHDQLVRQCYHGRRELLPYRSRCDLALGDSEFNRQELEALGFAPTGVLPVVPGFSHLDTTGDPRIAAAYDDEWTNILFVGRLIPNKRPDDLIRFFHAYKTGFNPRSRLILAGAYGGFEAYLAQLHALIAALEVRDVHILGQVTNEELTALYDVADLFLCASEHEGFCVPLIESFYKRVPVLAYAATAVPATMDGGGVLYESRDPRRVAALMNALVTDAGVEDQVLAAQDAALDRLLAQDFDGLLVGFVERVLASPRRPDAPVAYDFWRQFKLADELEEIRQQRPAAFRALPISPEEAGAVADLGERK